MDGLISCLGCLGPKIEQSCKLQPHTGLKMFHTQTGAVTSHQPSLGIVRTVWLWESWGIEVSDFGVDGCPPLLIQLWSCDPNCSAKTNLQMHTRSLAVCPVTSLHTARLHPRGVSNFPKAQAKEAPVEFQVTLVTWALQTSITGSWFSTHLPAGRLSLPSRPVRAAIEKMMLMQFGGYTPRWKEMSKT